MADLHAWRDASRELPPEGVPVWMMDGDGTVSIFETFRDDDGAACWAVCEYAPWWTGLALNPSWHSVSAYYEGARVARYWHPLPDVPTLAELDAHRDELATDAATAAASEGGGAVKLQRWNIGRGGLDTADVFDDHGEWVRWADVLAWRDSIRAAVEAERSEVEYVFGNWSVPDQKDTLGRWWDAQSALDALLAEGGV